MHRASPLLVVLLTLTACSSGPPEGPQAVTSVTASDTTCGLSSAEVASGTLRLDVSNAGPRLTDVYVYDGARVVGEVAGVDPGESASLSVSLEAGDYEVACKPGGTGKGVRTALRATGDGVPRRDPRLAAGVAAFTRWVQGQAAELTRRTALFTAAVEAGDIARAKALYAPSRIPWERIEPVAESFGDIDPKVDAREDGLEPGQVWTGWHKLEKDLWTTGTTDAATARQLLADVRDLQARVATVELGPDQLGNGAKELLDEVATGKVTGEEERYSRTDLVDFQANVEGAKQAYDALRPVAVDRDAALVATLDRRFAECFAALAPHGSGASFVAYDRLTAGQVRALAAVVDALGEPLSQLTATVLR